VDDLSVMDKRVKADKEMEAVEDKVEEAVYDEVEEADT
jgi:hypothetical protein